MCIPDQEEKLSTRKLSVKSLLGCDNKQVKKSTQIAFALATGFLFTLMLATVIMQAIILDIDLDDNNTAHTSESNSDENYNSDSEKCIVRGCHIFCVNLSLTRLIEISIKTAVKELKVCGNVSLVLQSINFDKKILPNYWLRDLTKPVSSIQIIGGNLQHISPDAFKSDTFTNLELIFINALAIIHLNEHSFSGIRNLHQLKINQIMSLELTTNTFQSLKTSLRTISIEDCGVWDPRLISSPVLSSLESAYFRFNDFKIKYLNQISLRGVKSTQILNLASSNIVSLEDGTFDEFENLMYINLNNNHLHSLPLHVFDHLVANNMNVTFDLHMNPWHCDCQLDFLRKLASNTMTMPTCSTPKSLATLTFDSIKSFCADNTIEYYTGLYNYASDPDQDLSTPTSCKIITKIQAPNEITEYNTIISKKTTDSFTEFCIMDEQQSSIRINFTGNLDGNYNLFWFPLSGSLVPDTVSCIPRVTGNVVLEDFQYGVYLFCLLDKNETVITSSHCKIHIRSTRGISLSWLTMSQKTTVLFIFGLSILSCLLLAACSVCLAVRNNSAILRASKRVIKVSNLRHRRNGEVYIMPTKLHKIIPTELRDTRRYRKSSKISTSSCKSGGTYMSTIEMNDSQSVSWKVKKASHNFQPKFTSVFAINKEEDKSDRRSTSLSDYL